MMSAQFTLHLIIMVILSYLSIMSYSGMIKECQIGGKDKCVGISRRLLGCPLNISNSYNITKQDSFMRCFMSCIDDVKCFMTVYVLSSQMCHYFNYANYKIVSTLYDCRSFIWRCCNTSIGTNISNRCPGYWRYKVYMVSYNNFYSQTIKYTTLTKNKCQEKCLSNPICGGVNVAISYLRQTVEYPCQLINAFPLKNIHMKSNTTMITYLWTCMDGYHVPHPKNNCSKINRIGYWKEDTRNSTLKRSTPFLMSFYTYHFEVCLKECKNNPKCQTPFFHKTSFRCILKGNGDTTCFKMLSHCLTGLIKYRWVSCKINQQTGKHMSNQTCIKILDYQNLWIAKDNCGRQPKNDDFYTCSRNRTGFSQLYGYKCSVNQSFTLLKRHGNVSAGFLHLSIGYTTLWLRYTNQFIDSIEYVKPYFCLLFNGDMLSGSRNKKRKEIYIISRKYWFANSPYNGKKRFSVFPLLYVIISYTHTNASSCGCYSQTSCLYSVLQLQLENMIIHSDINYNFVVTNDGNIYEGVGWYYQGHAEKIEMNQKALQIAVYGKYDSLNLKVIDSLKQLLWLGQGKGFLAKNYQIVITELDKRDSTFLLPKIIQLWPNFSNLSMKTECLTMNTEIGFTTGICVAMVTVILAVFILWIYRLKYKHYNIKLELKVLSSKRTLLKEHRCDIQNLLKDKSTKLGQELPYKSFLPSLTPFYVVEHKKEFLFQTERGNTNKNKLNCKCKKALFSLLTCMMTVTRSIQLGSIGSLNEVSSCAASGNDSDSDKDRPKNWIVCEEDMYGYYIECVIFVHRVSQRNLSAAIKQVLKLFRPKSQNFNNLSSTCWQFNVIKYKTTKSRTVFNSVMKLVPSTTNVNVNTDIKKESLKRYTFALDKINQHFYLDY